MSQLKQEKRLHKTLFRPIHYCFLLLPILLFASCDELFSLEDNDEPKITEVWVLQRVDISIIGGDGNLYTYSYTDKAHFDNEAQEQEDDYPYNYYNEVISPYAYVIFEDGRIESLWLSEDYEEFKKDQSVLFPLSSKNYEYYKIEDGKMYITKTWHWHYDLGDYLAYYVKSNDKNAIVLEVYGDAIMGYFHFDVPQYAWPVATHEDSHYHYTASYKKERK